MDIQKEYEAVGKPYLPPFPADSVSGLDRQQTMEVLAEASRIAEMLEECDAEIPALGKKIKAEQGNADALRNKLSKPVERKVWAITILAAVIGTFIVPVVLTIIFGIAAYLAAFVKFGGPDLAEHQEENDSAADTYIREHLVPLQTQLEQLTAIREDVTQNGKYAWAVEMVGEDLFFSACIKDLLDLVKSRRADNLKEALNKYDDEQHKARMQEMQQAAQRAAEAAAEEAKKQTKQLGNIEWNTAWTRWNTSRIRKNTKR